MLPKGVQKLLVLTGLALGCLVAYGAISLSTPSPEESLKVCQDNMHQIAAELEKYKEANGGYPTKLNLLPEEEPKCSSSISPYGYSTSGISGTGPRHEQRVKEYQVFCTAKGHFEQEGVSSENWVDPELNSESQSIEDWDKEQKKRERR
jgi:hypothetical protein